MNRSDLIQRLHELQPKLHLKDSVRAVEVILEAMSSTLSNGGRVEIRGFGSFVLKHRQTRIGHNPKTGVKVEVPAKYVPYFRVGKGYEGEGGY